MASEVRELFLLYKGWHARFVHEFMGVQHVRLRNAVVSIYGCKDVSTFPPAIASGLLAFSGDCLARFHHDRRLH